MSVGLTMRYATRHWLRELPLAAMRSERMLRDERTDPERRVPLREQMLRRTLERAAAVLPAYAWLKGRIPRQGHLSEFLLELPIISKAELLGERERYYPNRGRPRPWWSIGRTSGSTATPLEVFRSFDSMLWEQAMFLQHWAWVGWRPGERQAVLRGDLIVPLERSQPPFWFDDRAGRQLIVSTRHLNARNAAEIARALAEYRPALMRAYPSAAHSLGVLMREQSLHVPIRAVVTSSEGLLPMQRETIESVFSARVFDHYGMAERVAFGMQCEAGRVHIHPWYSHVEIVDDRGRRTDGPGQVVGTTFHNLAMPLVRYRVDDVAQWGVGPCPCGRTYPWLQMLQGRASDLLFDAEGQPVTAGVVTFAFKGVPHVAKAQVVQREAGRWQVKVVPLPGFGPATEAQLLQNFRRLVSQRVEVQVTVEDDIPVQPSGKYKWISQEFYPIDSRPAFDETAAQTPAYRA